MICRFGASSVAIAASVSAFACLAPASAAELPPVKVTAQNPVMECATPGRLTAYLKTRNDKLDPRFDAVATEYMRHGETLGIRWDIAFFQMLLETGYLSYKGDVKPNQNNFAGLGATGGGVRGESFKDVSTGVRAHIEHLLMYSGEKIENPVAERTRNIQAWGVLTDWQKTVQGPMTFTQLAKQWAPTSKAYVTDIKAIADRFVDGPCKDADPRPELVAEARGGASKPAKVVKAAAANPPAAASDGAPAKEKSAAATAPAKTAPAAKAKDSAKAEEKTATAAPEAKAKPAEAPPATTVSTTTTAPTPAGSKAPTVTVLNSVAVEPLTGTAAATASSDSSAKAEKTEKSGTAEKSGESAKNAKAEKPEKTETPAKSEKAEKTDKTDKAAKTEKVAALETASVAGAAKDAAKPAKKSAAKCKVWTASYGGSKAVIIKASADQQINYTVLDVNEGSEKRETDAYINAYAKGGERVGDFTSPTQALDKAFQLCPEG